MVKTYEEYIINRLTSIEEENINLKSRLFQLQQEVKKYKEDFDKNLQEQVAQKTVFKEREFKRKESLYKNKIEKLNKQIEDLLFNIEAIKSS